MAHASGEDDFLQMEDKHPKTDTTPVLSVFIILKILLDEQIETSSFTWHSSKHPLPLFLHQHDEALQRKIT